MIPSPPVRSPFADTQANAATLPWVKWFQSITAALTTGFGNITGVGNGGRANVGAPAKGSGSGPSDPTTVVQWIQVAVGTETFWVPLFK